MAAATPNQSSAVNLHPDSLQGCENREDRPKPAQLARDRRSYPPHYPGFVQPTFVRWITIRWIADLFAV